MKEVARTVGRILLDGVAMASLIVCVAAASLWARSYARSEYLSLEYGRESDQIRTGRGDFVLSRFKSNLPDAPPKEPTDFRYRWGPQVGSRPKPGQYPVQWQRGPFSYAESAPPPETDAQQRARRAIEEWNDEQAKPPPTATDLDAIVSRGLKQVRADEGRFALRGAGQYHWEFVFPAWLVVAITFPLPAWRGIIAVRRLQRWWCDVRERRLRRQRTRLGLCGDCGFDLRATSRRCPECGAPAPEHRFSAVA
jgi:hypothetical protein